MSPAFTAAATAERCATDLLREQQHALSLLFKAYRSDPGDWREAIARTIRLHVEVYLGIEDEVFYPVVRHEAEEAVRRARTTHRALRATLSVLESLSPADPEHGATMDRMMDALTRHMADEATGLFPQVEARLPRALRCMAGYMVQHQHSLAHSAASQR
jgi:hypothetical protein